MARSRPALATLVALAAASLTLAACGSGGGDSAKTPTTSATTAPRAATPPGRPSPYDPPTTVPREGNGVQADPAELAVVRRWVDALRAGRIGRAADTFADGSRIQNGTPIIILGSERERRAYLTAGFPCGARISDAQGADRGFIVVAFRIVDRVGGTGGCTGGPAAYAAIRVSGGLIREWYRVPGPDAPADPSEQQPS